MKTAVAYMRYSSHGQTEQSIEGQRKEIYAYAAKNDYTIINEYIDRALTGKNDQRPELQKIFKDSARRKFQVILVYQLDRFARNRLESAINKAKLKKHDVKVISVKENISDDPSGILLEATLEGIAEYYSAELSQKAKRGIAISVEKCKFIGGFVPLGYVIDDEKHYQIDPLTAPVVQKIFELYASGLTFKNINEEITNQFGKAYFGNATNSINRILDNRNYIGIYTRCGANVKGGVPQIIDDELFERVQIMREKHKKTPAKARSNEEYLLTTKLFCGHCMERIHEDVYMVGVSGTSKTGAIHNYYTCKNALHKKGCSKKNVKKSYIEEFVLSLAREQLTDENIELIAKTVSEISKKENNTSAVAEIKRKLKENAAAIDNLLRACLVSLQIL